MQIEDLVCFLDQPQHAQPRLSRWGLEDAAKGHANLVRIAAAGVTLDCLLSIFGQLEKWLPTLSDPDRALNNLERFTTASRSPLSLASLFERDEEALPILLRIFSASQHFSDVMVRDPESYDLLRMTEGKPAGREALVREICAEVELLQDERDVMGALRRFKHREMLRIAYGDIIQSQSTEIVTQQISFVADSICEAALRAARRKITEKWAVPQDDDGRPARVVVLGLGKLGGVELNYSSDIDLVFLYDEDPSQKGGVAGDSGGSIASQEFFGRLVRQFVKLLTEPTELGAAYRVDLRLRPDGGQGAACIRRDQALHYYDVYGRTWERQAFVKARPVAGDLDLGRDFLKELEPWIYRRYLSRADITGIKALKRRIEHRAEREQGDERNVKTGRGGIRDIEFVIQFLQLLNGGDLAELRGGNTLQAIANLERVGCLNMQERSILEENYALLRKIEHRLQIMFDLQTHTLPESESELRKLAIRAGYQDTPHGGGHGSTRGASALEEFQYDYQRITGLNRRILDHLLHDAFSDDPKTAPETDLVLDPQPETTVIEDTLGPYGFRDLAGAYANLEALATERIAFLSTRRCRHFLASIAPRLLEKIAATPDPDATLVNLSQVSDSLGGKGVLWELFSFHPPSLDLYVRLCASSDYLAGMMTSNPGMIDELMDSLMLDKLPSHDMLASELSELLRGAIDLSEGGAVSAILHSFKSAQHLRVGVRDILQKEDLKETHHALSDIAEVCLQQITRMEYQRLVKKYGQPLIGREGDQPCELIILALGKLGGQEPNYHSDLDVVFLYEADGVTRHFSPKGRPHPDGAKTTSNQHFFSQLGQRIIKVVNGWGPYGRLYELDPRLRPTGKSGALAAPISQFVRYFEEGSGQLWERQALCKARPVYGSPAARKAAMKAVRKAITTPVWRDEQAEEIRDMRRRLEETASRQNLKRGPGGTVDVEFAVQMLQLKNAQQRPEVLQSGTLAAIEALATEGCLHQSDAEFLATAYRFLRRIEAGLRLMNTTARHDFPEDQMEQKKLAYLLGYEGTSDQAAINLADEAARYTAKVRETFERLFGT